VQCSSHCTIAPTHIDDATKLTFALATRIGENIRPHRLTQAAAAQRLSIDQPKPSRLRHFYPTNFSTERLMPVLTLLARDVEIATKPTPRSRRPVRLRVIDPAQSAPPAPNPGA
jgi:predicted XRE-type DNA-binding protein